MSASAIHPPRRLLFGPGPTQVEARVYEALGKQVVGHMDPYYFEVMDEVRRLLRHVFGTQNECTFPISGTGSAGMETAVANFVEPGSKFAVFANGFFCDRLTEMGERQGAQVVRLEKAWGQTFTADEASAFLERERPATVAFVHAETSTGALQNPKAITEAAREIDAIVIADTVTSLGANEVNVDDNGIDVAYSCSQKGLSCPPGLAPFTASARAVDRLKARSTPVSEWYLDLRLLLDYYDGKKYHHTASSSMLYALCESLKLITEEGLPNRIDRHIHNHLALVRGLESLGLKMHVKEGERIPNLNTPQVPPGTDDARVRKHLLDRHGIEIAGGFGQLAGRIFRIGLMGPLSNESCVNMFLGAFEEALAA
jgi:alanine-glyoxylate transaminase/serine-glyoxylate transaminase/serine-pyruvate transaminase